MFSLFERYSNISSSIKMLESERFLNLWILWSKLLYLNTIIIDSIVTNADNTIYLENYVYT